MARWNRTGTATVTNGSAAVTGALTAWLSTVKPADHVTFDAGVTWYEVAAVASNTSMTLGSNFTGTTGAKTGASGLFAVANTSPAWARAGDLAYSYAQILEKITLLPPIVAGDAAKLLRVNAGATAFESVAYAEGQRRNLLINPAFLVNQRAFAGGAAATGVYTVDRWKAAGASTLSFGSGAVTISAGGIEQVVEPAGVGMPSLASTQLTLSVDSPSANVSVSIGATAGVITAGAGRRSFTATTGAGETGNISVKIQPVSGTVNVARPKLEIGPAATVWEPTRIEDEIANCRRYCSFIGKAGQPRYFMPGFYNDGGQFSFIVPYEQTMRAAPAASFVGTVATDYGVIYQGGVQTGFAFSTQNVGMQSLVVIAAKASHGLPVGSSNANFFCSVGGGLLLSAEL